MRYEWRRLHHLNDEWNEDSTWRPGTRPDPQTTKTQASRKTNCRIPRLDPVNAEPYSKLQAVKIQAVIRGFLCRKQLPLNAEEPTARRALERLRLPSLSREKTSTPLRDRGTDKRVIGIIPIIEQKNICLQPRRRLERLRAKYRARNEVFLRLHTLLVEQMNAQVNLSVDMISEEGELPPTRTPRRCMSSLEASHRVSSFSLERLCTRQNVSGKQTADYDTFFDMEYGAFTHIRTHLVITRPISTPIRVIQDNPRIVPERELASAWETPSFASITTSRPPRLSLELDTLQRPIRDRDKRLHPPERILQLPAFVMLPTRNSIAREIGQTQAGKYISRQSNPLDILLVHRSRESRVHAPHLAPPMTLKDAINPMSFSFPPKAFGFVASGNTFTIRPPSLAGVFLRPTESKASWVHSPQTEFLHSVSVQIRRNLDPTPDLQAIMSFCRHGKLEEIERAIHTLSMDTKDSAGNTFFLVACQNNQKRIARLLLRHGADINARNVSVWSLETAAIAHFR
uniref:Uncharacterized protein AlNc14C37G3263 n=1 Tax=Albugo laibachii Nc14 TaxID=890382 RepID=F0W8Y8_9STRA|nr:conserved hypothetical protein [Albugo laibachii Nc14]|eukprot:CCA17599.1 conserved hypothetical protein [Albugo laibachii Nc14]